MPLRTLPRLFQDARAHPCGTWFRDEGIQDRPLEIRQLSSIKYKHGIHSRKLFMQLFGTKSDCSEPR